MPSVSSSLGGELSFPTPMCKRIRAKQSWRLLLHLVHSTRKFKAQGLVYRTGICWTLPWAPICLVWGTVLGKHCVKWTSTSIQSHIHSMSVSSLGTCQAKAVLHVLRRFGVSNSQCPCPRDPSSAVWEMCAWWWGPLCGVDCVKYWEARGQARARSDLLRDIFLMYSWLLVSLLRLQSLLFMSSGYSL